MRDRIVVDRTEMFTIVQSSMEYDDDTPEIREDAAEVFELEPDIAMFSESEVRGRVRPVLLKAAMNARYAFRAGGPGGVAFAVHPRHQIESVTDVAVLPAKSAPNPHGERSVFGPTLVTPAGNSVSVFTAHWTTADRGDAAWQAMTQAMIEEVQRAAFGRSIAFWTGDTNRNDTGKPDEFVRNGLMTCWDEEGRYPATLGKFATIDVVGSFDPDTRAELVTARAGSRRNSNHRFVVAKYRINPTTGTR